MNGAHDEGRLVIRITTWSSSLIVMPLGDNCNMMLSYTLRWIIARFHPTIVRLSFHPTTGRFSFLSLCCWNPAIGAPRRRLRACCYSWWVLDIITCRGDISRCCYIIFSRNWKVTKERTRYAIYSSPLYKDTDLESSEIQHLELELCLFFCFL